MKLLFDQNLSHRLVRTLADVYPDCQHVRNVGLGDASDTQVWNYARSNGYTIVSKDSDFYQRSLAIGFPPKVIWVRLGNCTTTAIEELLREHVVTVEQFEADATATFLVLP
jgi:predicted nuclease of predicted toxin-antitoxin system